ncbi:transglutaminase-like domain-containing protein [Pseudoalteromonas aurantia]|uniref:Transglutaminase n=1 Tax=Pseudoalteromonas aurantia TaxID=43654 RepID=A0A5S3VB16_9GAMM|nr:transglutaminase family protein [Pseudoalteromonas aurantia]TMO69146.1 transglutaminase [Pseudoalteromonas aurantia]
MQQYLLNTYLLNYTHHHIQTLITQKQWLSLNPQQALTAIYNFVMDDIKFGYSSEDTLNASTVLHQGYGQCNTKGTLLMALLRGVGIPCRLQGFTIRNNLKRGVMPRWVLALAPAQIIHSWVEVYLDGTWLELEGYIIDNAYLSAVQSRFKTHHGRFVGYGIATPCLQNPKNQFHGQSTYIQRESIITSLGYFADPDCFYQQHRNLPGAKKWLYKYLLRHIINRRIVKIRHSMT